MARLNKTGLDYHPLYVDLDSDEKMRYLLAESGIFGELVLLHIWRMIYRDKGYYCEFNNDRATLLSADFAGQIKRREIIDVVDVCVKRNLFDAKIYKESGILTSRKIQEIYISATLERRILWLEPKYWIGELPRSTKGREIRLIGSDSTDKYNKSTDQYNYTDDQFIKEGSTAKEGKEGDFGASQIARFPKDYFKDSLEERKEAFRGAVTSFMNIYDAKCLEKFYNVWAEHNTGGNRMKWELEKVWNLEDRLRRWYDGWMETERKKAGEGPKKSRMQHNRDVGTEVLKKLMNEQG